MAHDIHYNMYLPYEPTTAQVLEACDRIWTKDRLAVIEEEVRLEKLYGVVA